jgi:hypothetical protein
VNQRPKNMMHGFEDALVSAASVEVAGKKYRKKTIH